MACGSCGGARARTVVGADGQQRMVAPRTTRYVWTWVPSAGGDPVQFKSEGEAREWLKGGNPGTIYAEPVR